MAWYVSKIVFRIVINDQPSSQFDEQIRLIEASSIDDAFTKAQEIGVKEQDCFEGLHKQELKWVYIGTSHIHALNSLSHGEQFFSLTKDADEADSYANFIRSRSNTYVRNKKLSSHYQLV